MFISFRNREKPLVVVLVTSHYGTKTGIFGPGIITEVSVELI